MSIVFSAIVPHPPLLIPQIGKDNILKLANTAKAYESLAASLEAAKPDTLLIITPHSQIQPETFTINLNPEFTGEFKEFGDFSTLVKAKGDIGLAHRIRERLETKAKLNLTSLPNLDYGTSVPLFLLGKNLANLKIIPLAYSMLSLEEHFEFGRILQRELIVQQEKIAVIASGDLSHRLSKNSPSGYSAKGKKFDMKLLEILRSGKLGDIIKIDSNLIEQAAECGLRSLAILAGILDGIKNEPKELSYESPFGVGYLVMEFKF